MGLRAWNSRSFQGGLESNRNGATSKLIGEGIEASVFGDINTDNKDKG